MAHQGAGTGSSGQSDAALDTLYEFAVAYPEHPLAPQALWEAGQQLEGLKELPTPQRPMPG